MVLSLAFSFLYNSQPAGLSAERENLKGPLILAALATWKFKDTLNKINELTVTVFKSDIDRNKIFFEREVFIPAFDFRGLITGLTDINDSILQITMHERAWHFTRRIYKISDSLKEYNLTLANINSFPDFIQLILDSANADMPFTWVLGEGETTNIPNLISLWKFEDNVLDSKGSNNGTVSGIEVYVTGKYTKALDFNAVDTKVDFGSDTSLDNIFDGGGTFTTFFNARSDGESDIGQIAEKGQWEIKVRDEAGGLVRIEFIQAFSGTNGIWQTDVDIPINTIMHVAVVYDNGLTSNDPTIYINRLPKTVGDGLTRTSTPVGTRDTDAASVLTVGNNPGQTATFDGFIDDSRSYSVELIASEIRTIFNAKQSYIDNFRTDEIPSSSTFNFDIKWKSYYEVLRQVAINSLNDLWFEDNRVYIGTKGKNITLDRDDKIYEKLKTNIDLDTYGNIVNIVGAKSGGTNLHTNIVADQTDLLYNYERVVSNNNLITQASVDGVADRILEDFDSITADVSINIREETIQKYKMKSGDIIKIVANSETQTVRGFYRLIKVITASTRSLIKLQFSKTGKFIPRISDSLDMLEATLIKIHDIELNS